MAGVLLRLKLRLLGNTVRRGGNAALGLVLAAVFGLPASLAVAAAFVGTSTAPRWPDAVVVAFAVVWTAWLVLPLVNPAPDDTLDPRRFSLLPLRPRELVPGLLLGAHASVGPVLSVVVLAGVVIGTGVRSVAPVPSAVALVAAVLTVVASVSTHRALGAVLADVLAGRRGREVVALLSVPVFLGLVYAPQVLIAQLSPTGPPALAQRLVAVAGWTPGGAGGAAIGAALDGELTGVMVRLAVVVGWILVMLLVWGWAFARVQVRAPTHGSSPRRRAALYPWHLAWLPHTRLTAVAARFLRSLARDGRVRNPAIGQTFFVVPLVLLSAASIPGPDAPLYAAYLAVPFGLMASNQLGLDGPALWQHHLAGTDTRTDLLGRSLAMASLGLPVATLTAIGLAVAFDAWSALPDALLLAGGVLATMLGVANAASVLAPFPVPEEAASAFGGSGSTNAGCLQAVVLLVVVVVHGVLVLPVALPLALLDAGPVRTAVAGLGLAYGLAMLVGGTHLGEVRARGRGPELLAAVDPRNA